MSLLVFLLSGAIAWLCPMLGYGLFMLLQTPLGNMSETFGHLFSAQVLLILATVRLLVRKPKRLGSRRLRGVEICALALSLVVLLRQVELMLMSEDLRYASGQALSLAFAWGPLFVVFNRLDEKEMASLRLWMSVAGMVVGVWGSLVYLTGNGYLMQMAVWGNADTVRTGASSASANAEQLVTSRFIVQGLFLVVPSAYWYVLRGALAQTRQHWLWKPGMWAGVATILVAAGMSVTRGTILVLGMGTVVMLVAQVLSGGGGGRNRASMVAILTLVACGMGAAFYLTDFTPMVEQVHERFSTLGQDEVNVAARLNNTANAWAYLSQNRCFFGAPGPDPYETASTSVDCAVVLQVWLLYGVPGVVLFSALFFTAFGRLFKSWLARGLSREQRLLRSMLTAWSLYFVYIWIVGYCLTATEVFFTMLFVSEIDRLKSKVLTTTNSQPRRTAA